LHDLALLYRRQGRYEEAIESLEAALAIDESVYGPRGLNVATRLAAIGQAYRDAQRYDDAALALERALRIREAAFGPSDPRTARALTMVARFYADQGRYRDAELLLERSLAIHQDAGGGESDVALNLANLGALHVAQGDYDEARPFYERALSARHASPQVSAEISNLALAARADGRPGHAEEIYRWALELTTSLLGAEDASTTFLRSQYAQFLRSLGRGAEAEQISGG
jgi:tetratricopeptide (TPR) repeat protein